MKDRDCNQAVLVAVVVALLTLSQFPLAFGSQDDGNGANHSHTGHAGVSLASWNINYVSPMLEISAFVLLAGLLKIGKFKKKILKCFKKININTCK